MPKYQKKATLLIRNIHKLYTMDAIATNNTCEGLILEHAFLAVHHDYILAIGKGDPTIYIDSDTKIIEADNLIIVPGFIDMGVVFPTMVYFKEQREYLLKLRHHLHCLSKSGVTTVRSLINSEEVIDEAHRELLTQRLGKWLQIRLLHDVITHKDLIENKEVACINPWEDKTIDAQPFTLATGDLHCDDLLLCARLLYRQGILASSLLKGLTIDAARVLNMQEIGVLKQNNQADFLLIQANDIDELFQHMGSSTILSVYKAGILVNHYKN
ncbi:MAG: hypothetical protein RR524_01805 [Erysipelotrichaceae bacterium]